MKYISQPLSDFPTISTSWDANFCLLVSVYHSLVCYFLACCAIFYLEFIYHKRCLFGEYPLWTMFWKCPCGPFWATSAFSGPGQVYEHFSRYDTSTWMTAHLWVLWSGDSIPISFKNVFYLYFHVSAAEQVASAPAQSALLIEVAYFIATEFYI